MTSDVLATRPAEAPADLLAVYVVKGAKKPEGVAAEVDKLLGGHLKAALEKQSFEGKAKDFVIYPNPRVGATFRSPAVAFIGLGKPSATPEDHLEALRIAGATLVKAARRVKATSVATVIPPHARVGAATPSAGRLSSPPDLLAQALLEGVRLAAYRFQKYKSETEPDGLTTVSLLVDTPASPAGMAAAKKGLARAEVFSDSVNLARDLINTPANDMTPARLAEAAQSVAKSSGLSCEVLELEACRKMGMGLFYSVAKGSHEPAKFIVLRYKGRKKETVAVVGKGITFDSGGISIKGAKAMWEMKGDMSGGAAVIGVLKAVAVLKPDVSVIGVIPATENMPGGGAQKPGDIWKSLAGPTVEVINTDAEGRLVLGDALTYAERQGAKTIIDLATLTGGVRVALGDLYSGILGNDQKLQDALIQAGRQAGEKYWPFPMDEAYEDYLKSDVADLMNCTEHGKASPIQGGIFLKRFVKDAAWAHLDIAGTFLNDRDVGPTGKGPTGVGVRTILTYLTR